MNEVTYKLDLPRHSCHCNVADILCHLFNASHSQSLDHQHHICHSTLSPGHQGLASLPQIRSSQFINSLSLQKFPHSQECTLTVLLIENTLLNCFIRAALLVSALRHNYKYIIISRALCSRNTKLHIQAFNIYVYFVFINSMRQNQAFSF